MKFLLTCFLLFIINCKKQDKPEQINNLSDQYIYMVNYNTNQNFSIYLNGFLLKENKNNNASEGGLIELNPFIGSSSMQNIRIVLQNEGGNLKANELDTQSFELVRAKTPREESQFENLQKATFIFKPKEDIISDINFKPEINYDTQEISLSDAQDLSKLNQDDLLKKVISAYDNYGNIINDGNASQYQKLFANAHQREIKSMYYTSNEEKKLISKLTERITTSKGNLQSLENYTMYIHPNGKIVELRTSTGKSPLFSKIDGKIKRFGLYLYLPNQSAELKVY